MANTLEVGLNTGTIGYFEPNTPFKDLIKNSPFPWRDNVTLSGVLYRRAIYVPSGFPHEVSGDVGAGSGRHIYISASSNEDGWPTSLAYGSLMMYGVQEFPIGGMSATCPPSSTDNPSAAVFHLLYDGQGAGGAFPFRIRYAENNGALDDADRVQVSAGEWKVSGMDTRTITSFWVQTISIDENDPPRNIRLVHQDYRDNFESEPFFPQMVNYYKSMTTSGGPVRNMKWARTNESQFGLLSSVHGTPFELSTTLIPTGCPQGGYFGISYAYQAQFANAIERDLWVNIHYLADDATVSAIASTIQSELDSNRKVYVELGNEWWNTAYPYNQQRYYFTEQAEANGGSSVYDLPGHNDGTPGYPDDYEMAQAYAVQRSIDIYKIFENYFTSDRLVNVLAAQFVATSRNKAMLLFSGAYNYVDALAVNPYVGNILGNNATVAAAVQTSGWDSNDLFQFMYDSVSGTESIPIAGSNAQPIRMSLTNTKDMLDASSEFSGIDIIGYEGGHHLNVAIGGSARAFLIDLFGGTKYDSRWSHWNQYLCSTLADYGMETHVHFVDISEWSADDDSGNWEWFGVIPQLGAQTPTRTGLETYVAGAIPDPTPTPPPELTTQQLGYRIDINVNSVINLL